MKWIIAIVALAALIGFAGFSSWRFHQQIEGETKALLANDVVINQPIEEEMLKDLPTPVQHWLIAAGVLGKKPVQTVHLQQKGLMRLKPEQEKWMKAEAEQTFTTDTPGFIWKVNTSMAGIPVVGRDLFSQGQGFMEIRLAGCIPVVKVSNQERINEATIQRYLGEIVWFPSAALSHKIQWEKVDDYSAKATMTYNGTKGSALFHFNQQGEVTHFVAQRFRDINDESRTEWVATVKETDIVNGISIPVKLEATWMLEDGPFTWYRFEVFNVTYNNQSAQKN